MALAMTALWWKPAIDRNLLVLKTDCVVAGVHFLPTANALRRWLESNDASAQRFRRNVSRASICADHSHCPEQTKVEWVKAALSRTPPGREAVQSQHSRRRNERHTGPDGDFG